MEDILLKFLSKFPEMSEEKRTLIAENLKTEEFKKGTYLIKEGKIPNKCYFVLEGLVRQYYIVDGIEKTTEFYTEHSAVTSSGYFNQTPVDYYLECLENTVLIVGQPNEDVKMIEEFPVLEQITRVMMEEEWDKTKEKHAAFITSSPEKRYLNLLETRPKLFNRMPQHQIASYLGITPESLSRIRKRLIEKEKKK